MYGIRPVDKCMGKVRVGKVGNVTNYFEVGVCVCKSLGMEAYLAYFVDVG